MRFKLIKWTRQIRIWFGGRKGMEQEHYLFQLFDPKTTTIRVEALAEKLWPNGWGYNVMSHTYRGQIFTTRKPKPPRHQWHLRFYSNGSVSGHYEVDPIQFPLEHLDGIDLRELTTQEKGELWELLVGKG